VYVRVRVCMCDVCMYMSVCACALCA